jgi:hypothetical protein
MKKLSKKIQDTQKEMQDSRIEDSVLLRKKAEELIHKANDDVKFILKTKEDLLNQINALTVRLNKTEGALQILKILLEK